MTQAAIRLDSANHLPKEREGKYLTFMLGDEDYGLEILKVREIIGMMDITAIPQTPPYIKGVINLRGRVIPVIDLRLKFGLPSLDYGERTCIIVADVAGGDGPMQMGVVVDAVSEVMHVSSEEIEPPPSFGTGLSTSYLLGIAKARDRIKILLDIDQVLTAEELAGMEQMGG
jgi:purine-binding chemotaxis protein CheW